MALTMVFSLLPTSVFAAEGDVAAVDETAACTHEAGYYIGEDTWAGETNHAHLCNSCQEPLYFSPVYVAQVDATAGAAGMKAHYACPCGVLFLPQESEGASYCKPLVSAIVSAEALAIEKLPSTCVCTAYCTEGAVNSACGVCASNRYVCLGCEHNTQVNICGACLNMHVTGKCETFKTTLANRGENADMYVGEIEGFRGWYNRLSETEKAKVDVSKLVEMEAAAEAYKNGAASSTCICTAYCPDGTVNTACGVCVSDKYACLACEHNTQVNICGACLNMHVSGWKYEEFKAELEARGPKADEYVGEIEGFRAQYNRLSDTEKAKVDVSKLEDLEAAAEAYKNGASGGDTAPCGHGYDAACPVCAVEALIDELNGDDLKLEVTVPAKAMADSIYAANTAYGQLSAEDQAKADSAKVAKLQALVTEADAWYVNHTCAHGSISDECDACRWEAMVTGMPTPDAFAAMVPDSAEYEEAVTVISGAYRTFQSLTEAERAVVDGELVMKQLQLYYAIDTDAHIAACTYRLSSYSSDTILESCPCGHTGAMVLDYNSIDLSGSARVVGSWVSYETPDIYFTLNGERVDGQPQVEGIYELNMEVCGVTATVYEIPITHIHQWSYTGEGTASITRACAGCELVSTMSLYYDAVFGVFGSQAEGMWELVGPVEYTVTRNGAAAENPVQEPGTYHVTMKAEGLTWEMDYTIDHICEFTYTGKDHVITRTCTASGDAPCEQNAEATLFCNEYTGLVDVMQSEYWNELPLQVYYYDAAGNALTGAPTDTGTYTAKIQKVVDGEVVATAQLTFAYAHVHELDYHVTGNTVHQFCIWCDHASAGTLYYDELNLNGGLGITDSWLGGSVKGEFFDADGNCVGDTITQSGTYTMRVVLYGINGPVTAEKTDIVVDHVHAYTYTVHNAASMTRACTCGRGNGTLTMYYDVVTGVNFIWAGEWFPGEDVWVLDGDDQLVDDPVGPITVPGSYTAYYPAGEQPLMVEFEIDHACEFTFINDGAKLTRVCATEGCANSGATVELVLDKDTNTVSSRYSPNWKSRMSPVSYFANEQEPPLSAPPTQPGSYVATVLINTDNGSQTIRLEYTIGGEVHEHELTYTVEGDVLVQSCECGHRADVMAFYDETLYTGLTTYTNNWIGDRAAPLFYRDGVLVGDTITQPGTYVMRLTAGNVFVEQTIVVDCVHDYHYGGSGSSTVTRSCRLCNAISRAYLVYDVEAYAVRMFFEGEPWIYGQPTPTVTDAQGNVMENAGVTGPGDYTAVYTEGDLKWKLEFTVEHMCIFTYEVNGASCTRTCQMNADCIHSGTVTLVRNEAANVVHARYPGNWNALESRVEYWSADGQYYYEAPTAEGSYYARIYVGGNEVRLDYTICDHDLRHAVIPNGDYEGLQQTCAKCDHKEAAAVAYMPDGSVDLTVGAAWIGEQPAVHYYEGDTDLGVTAPTEEGTYAVKLVLGDVIAVGNSFTIAHEHVNVYIASGNVMYEVCGGEKDCGHEATATLAVDETGKGTVTYADNWKGDRNLTVSYKDADGKPVAELTDGKFTAFITVEEATAFVDFTLDHAYTYTAEGAVLTQLCTRCGAAATAKLVLNEETETADRVYSADWAGDKPLATYTKDGQPVEKLGEGTYVAHLTVGGADATLEVIRGHKYSYSTNGAVITQLCSRCGEIATATLTHLEDNSVAMVYEGDWQAGEDFIITIKKDGAVVNAITDGSYVITAVSGELTAELTFDIEHICEYVYNTNEAGTGAVETCAAQYPCDHEETAVLHYNSTDVYVTVQFSSGWQGSRDYELIWLKDGYAVEGMSGNGSYKVDTFVEYTYLQLPFTVNCAHDGMTYALRAYDTSGLEQTCDVCGHRAGGSIYYDDINSKAVFGHEDKWVNIGGEPVPQFYKDDVLVGPTITQPGTYSLRLTLGGVTVRMDDIQVSCVHAYTYVRHNAASVSRSCDICGIGGTLTLTYNAADGVVVVMGSNNDWYSSYPITVTNEQGEVITNVYVPIEKPGKYTAHYEEAGQTWDLEFELDHLCDFTYVVEGAKATRTCSHAGCVYSPAAVELVFDEAAGTVRGVCSDNWCGDTPYVRYYAANDTGTPLPGAPTEPGDYVAKVYLYTNGQSLELVKAYTLEHKHDFAYTTDGAVITETCTGAGDCDHTATAALTRGDDNTFSMVYDGDWQAGEDFAITITRDGAEVDAVTDGSYIVTAVSGDLTATLTFTIEHICSYVYALNEAGSGVVETCDAQYPCDHMETAALRYDNTDVYADLIYSLNWQGERDITVTLSRNETPVDGFTGNGSYKISAYIEDFFAQLYFDVNCGHAAMTYSVLAGHPEMLEQQCAVCGHYAQAGIFYEPANNTGNFSPFYGWDNLGRELQPQFYKGEALVGPAITQPGTYSLRLTLGDATARIDGIVVDCIHTYTYVKEDAATISRSCTCGAFGILNLNYDVANHMFMLAWSGDWYPSGLLTVTDAQGNVQTGSTVVLREPGKYTAVYEEAGQSMSLQVEMDHFCTFSYVQNGNCLTRTCDSADCPNSPATLELVYEPDMQLAYMKASENWKQGIPGVQFYSKDAAGNLTELDSAPAESGTYVAKATMYVEGQAYNMELEYSFTHEHHYMYTAEGSVITETCSCGHYATLTLEYDPVHIMGTFSTNGPWADRSRMYIDYYKDGVKQENGPVTTGVHTMELTLYGATAVCEFNVEHLHVYDEYVVNNPAITGKCQCGVSGTYTLTYREDLGMVYLAWTVNGYWPPVDEFYEITVTQLGRPVENNREGITAGKYVAACDVEGHTVTLEFEIPHTCSYVYTADGAVISELCDACVTCDHAATATVTYAGEKQAAAVAYSEGWQGGDLTVTYTGDGYSSTEVPTGEGSYTASITKGGVTASAAGVVSHVHQYTYILSGAVVTEACVAPKSCGHTAEAKLVYAEASKTASVTYSDSWVGARDAAVTYTDASGKTVTALTEGEFTAAADICGKTATLDITIDHVHKYVYSVSGAVLQEVCAGIVPCGHAVEAELVYDAAAKAVSVHTGTGWAGGALTITYKQGDTLLTAAPAVEGSYTASITKGEATASLDFTIPHECVYTYTAENGVLTQTCAGYIPCGHTASGAMTYDETTKTVSLTWSEDWAGEKPAMFFTDAAGTVLNAAPAVEGSYTAHLKAGDAEAVVEFVIPHEHVYTYSVDKNVMTEACTGTIPCGHVETAALRYDGNRREAVVDYSAGWLGGELTVTYNQNEATAPTASGSHSAYAAGHGFAVSVDFSIAEVKVTAPTAAKPADSSITLSGAGVTGVNQLAEQEAPKEEADPSKSTTVTVEVAVDYHDEANATEAEKQDVAKMEVVAEASTNLEVIEISVEKTTVTTTTDETSGSAPTVETETEPIADTKTVLELMIPYNFAGKMNITVYRTHDGVAEAFRELDARPASAAAYQDGTFYCDKVNHCIYVYTQYFSMYGVGHDVAKTITYMDGGAAVHTEEYAVGKGTAALYAPTKTGYTLAWYDASTGGNAVTAIGADADTDITLYARWTANSYKVTFDGTAEVRTVTFDEAYGTLPVLTRDGFRFLGWFTVATGGTEVKADTRMTTAADHTLYGQWEQVDFTVTLEPNGGSGAPTTLTGKYGDPLPGADVMQRTGYTFVEWQDETGKKAETITADGKLSAVWKANTYTVTLDMNDGTGKTKTITVTFDGKYDNLPGAAAMQREGYTFVGWELVTKAKAAVVVDAATTVTTPADHKLVAVWKANTYTVSFDKQGGTGTANPITVTYDGTYGTLPTLTKTDLYFAGWYTAKTGGTKITADKVVKITADTTLYAQWSTVPVTGDDSMASILGFSGLLLTSAAALIVLMRKKREN